MRIYQVIILFLLTICQVSLGQEYRGGISAEFSIAPRIEAEAEIELRRIFYPGTYINRTFQGSVSYSFSKSLSADLVYSFALIDKSGEFSETDLDNEKSERSKLALDLQYQPGRFNNDIRLSNRLRYQYAVVDRDDAPKQVIRERLKIDYKISGKMNPYVAIEPYYSLKVNKIKVVRFWLGNEFPLFGTEMELYYIAEINLKIDHNTVQYIVGATLKLDFKK